MAELPIIFFELALWGDRMKTETDRLTAREISRGDAHRAHAYSGNHKPELEKDDICGCFFCKRIFRPSEIEDWIISDGPGDERGTAVCPYCGVDSVIGRSSGYPVTREFLTAMNKIWFG